VNSNFLLMLAGMISFVEILQIKYLNNLVEQDHRFIKKITNPIIGFKAFYSAKATIVGIETAHMIRKGRLFDENMPAYKLFLALVKHCDKTEIICQKHLNFYYRRTVLMCIEHTPDNVLSLCYICEI
jgi:putative transposase